MKLYFFVCFLLTSTLVQSQQYRYLYYFNEEFQPVSKNDALIIARGAKTQDGVRVDFFASKTGKKLFSTDFTDSTLNEMNGRNIEYDEKENPVQLNYYKHNILDGVMQKWDTAGRMTDSIIYSNGKMLNKTKFGYNKNGILVNYYFTDSVNDKMNVVYFDSAQQKTSQVFFIGNKGIWNHYKSGSIDKTDSVFTREEKDASYPGGPEGWRRYLERNLNPIIPIRNSAPLGNYTVTIQFMVDTEGNVSGIKPLTNLGYGTEEEVLRVIKRSGKWIPAERFGKKVKAYRKQPLTFQVQQNPPGF